MESIWLVNGRRTQIDPSDRGLAYGDGLFETMAAESGRIRWLARHLARLRKGCARLEIPCPDLDSVRAEIRGVCPPAGRAAVKLIVTRGPGGRGYCPPESPAPTRILSVSAWPDYPPENYTDGIELRTCEIRVAENPCLAGLKHLNRLEQVLAQAEISASGAQEGLMLSVSGTVVGGTMSNIFVIKDGRAATPELGSCGVHGVMRGVVLDRLRSGRNEPIERSLRARELGDADELFMTNALFGIWPVRKLDGRDLSVGPVTLELMRALEIGPLA